MSAKLERTASGHPGREARPPAWHLELRLSLQESPPPAYSGACLWLITLGRSEARSVLGESVFSVNAEQERARTPSICPFLFLLTDPVEKHLGSTFLTMPASSAIRPSTPVLVRLDWTTWVPEDCPLPPLGMCQGFPGAVAAITKGGVKTRTCKDSGRMSFLMAEKVGPESARSMRLI